MHGGRTNFGVVQVVWILLFLDSSSPLDLKNRQRERTLQTERPYWFPAKKHGWGWGVPNAWQGWVVLAIFFALLFAGLFPFPPHTKSGAYVTYVALLCGLLVAVCWIKGEPPRWRSRKDDAA